MNRRNSGIKERIVCVKYKESKTRMHSMVK